MNKYDTGRDDAAVDQNYYIGTKQSAVSGGPCDVFVNYEDNKLDPRNGKGNGSELKSHSPSGFAWGYTGSGPAQLSLAILAYEYDDNVALDYYQDFKRAAIATLEQDEGWTITSAEIQQWMEAQR